MSINRRITRKKAKSNYQLLQRMGDILAAGHGTKADVTRYNRLLADDLLNRALAIIDIAEQTHSWDHMIGSFSQTMEIYVLASILYEKYPHATIMSDGAFDRMGRFLLKHKDKLSKDFMDWYTITAIDLKAGTGSAVTAQPNTLLMVDIYLKRNGHGNAARLLRGPAKRGQSKPEGIGGKRVRKLVRRAK